MRCLAIRVHASRRTGSLHLPASVASDRGGPQPHAAGAARGRYHLLRRGSGCSRSTPQSVGQRARRGVNRSLPAARDPLRRAPQLRRAADTAGAVVSWARLTQPKRSGLAQEPSSRRAGNVSIPICRILVPIEVGRTRIGLVGVSLPPRVAITTPASGAAYA
jgi:hypothetical protein